MTDAIGTELKRVSLHIQNADYSPIETLVKEQLANADFDDVEVEFNALKARIEAAENSKPLPEFTSKESQTGFAKLLNLSTLILSSPLFAIGYIVNLPNLVANYFVQKRIKDIHFKASVNFGLSLIINTLVLLILAIYQFLSSYTWYGALITTVFFGFCLFFHKLWQEKRLNYFA